MSRFGMGLEEYRMTRQRDRYMQGAAEALDQGDEELGFMYNFLLDDIEADMEIKGYEVI